MADLIANMIRWPRRALASLMRARLFIFTASIVVLAIMISLCFLQTEQSVRLTGLLLQLLGIAAAAIGIRDTRRMFGKPSFLELIRTWARAIPRLRLKSVSSSASSRLSVSATCKAQVWHGAGTEPTIESRLAAAEANLQELNSRANKAEFEFDAHVRQSAQSLRDERAERLEADRQLHLKIESASTDGLHLAAVGVAWLACGAILSTMPNELLWFVR